MNYHKRKATIRCAGHFSTYSRFKKHESASWQGNHIYSFWTLTWCSRQHINCLESVSWKSLMAETFWDFNQEDQNIWNYITIKLIQGHGQGQDHGQGQWENQEQQSIRDEDMVYYRRKISIRLSGSFSKSFSLSSMESKAWQNMQNTASVLTMSFCSDSWTRNLFEATSWKRCLAETIYRRRNFLGL